MTDGLYNNVRRPAVGTGPAASSGKSLKAKSDTTSVLPDTSTQAAKPKANANDHIQLSNVNKLLAQEPAFDRAKVESIKQAIQDGQYPLNPRHIAESFHAIEQMISE